VKMEDAPLLSRLSGKVMFDMPIVTSDYVPPGQVYLFGDKIIARPETVGLITDNRFRMRLKRAWNYIKLAWREVFPRRVK
jgi:hypothetical protein